MHACIDSHPHIQVSLRDCRTFPPALHNSTQARACSHCQLHHESSNITSARRACLPCVPCTCLLLDDIHLAALPVCTQRQDCLCIPIAAELCSSSGQIRSSSGMAWLLLRVCKQRLESEFPMDGGRPRGDVAAGRKALPSASYQYWAGITTP